MQWLRRHATRDRAAGREDFGARAGVVLLGLLGACVFKREPDLCQPRYERGPCVRRYSPYDGYYQYCRRVRVGETCPWDRAESNASAGGGEAPPEPGGGEGAMAAPSAGLPSGSSAAVERPATSSAADMEASAPADAGAASAAASLPARDTPFDLPCERDNQCGSGQCQVGLCFYGCTSDADCGTGDRCATESGRRLCSPDPSPPVECIRSSECGAGKVCLNASCRDTCDETADCSNLLDRCVSGICEPDRRPLVECVLSAECGVGEVCLDGACAVREGGNPAPFPPALPESPAPGAPEPIDAGVPSTIQ